MISTPTPDRPSVLTAAQRDAYARDGYVIVDDVLTADELSALNDVVDELIERPRIVTESDELFDLEPGHSGAAPKLRRIKDPQRHQETFDRVMRSPRVLDAVADVVGPDVRFVAGKLNLKHSGGGAAVEWHQDHA